MNNKRENLVVGLDIGTTKICAIVGAMTEEGLDIVAAVNQQMVIQEQLYEYQ